MLKKDMYYHDTWDGFTVDLKKGPSASGRQKQQIQYVRFRDEEGDIGRIRRQQHFLMAVYDKITSADMLLHIPGLAKQLTSMVKTDMPLGDMIDLGRALHSMVKEKGLSMAMVPGTPKYIDGISYWLPDITDLRELMVKMQGATMTEHYKSAAELMEKEYNNAVEKVEKGDDSEENKEAIKEEKELKAKKEEKAKEEKDLEVFFNTVMYDCETKDDRIVSIYCVQETTEMRYQLYAPVFVDATGNGTLGYYAGAEYRKGSEPQSEFGELHAPQQPNNYRMGNSILLKAKDMGHPVKFTPPSFAKKLTEEQLAKRIHCVQMRDTINCDDSPNPEEYKRTSMTSSACVDYGYWWLELCGDGEDIITEYEAIRDDLIAYAYGIWDHIKNNKEGIHEHHAENYALEWVGALPGVRESRRLVGDYLLSETDILEHKIFEDAVCYGGWCVDLHAPHGLLDFNLLPSDCNFYDGVYTIPYRSYYSKNIKNLYMAGRDISTTRLGLASTRIIGCCAIGGEAVGIAAALCNKYACDPRELAPHVKELQQLILKEDGFCRALRMRMKRSGT